MPVAVILTAPDSSDLDPFRVASAVIGAGFGWLVTLQLSAHPLIRELWGALLLIYDPLAQVISRSWPWAANSSRQAKPD